MQLIAPYKFKEEEFKNIKKEYLFKDERDNFVNLVQIAWECNEEEKIAPLLASIDPYDNTIFNSRQCEMILLEIDEILKMRDVEGVEKIVEILQGIDLRYYLLLSGD